jgi:hypothetical protein
MYTLGWINAKEQDIIYQSYLDMTQRMLASTKGVTSHEYIFRVLGQKFNLASDRISAICVLKHNEEQMKARGDPIDYDRQDFMDQNYAAKINAAYMAYNEVNPGRFIEPSLGNPDTDALDPSFIPVDDLVDVDAILDEVSIREKEKARIAIDTHVYKEDIDEDTISVKISSSVYKIMKQHARMSSYAFTQRPEHLTPLPAAGAEPRRARWKFACHFADATKKDKAKQKFPYKGHKRRKNKVTENTLIEIGGLLRPATLKEVKCCAWKPKRDASTFTYRDLHEAWLDRRKTGNTKLWGRQEAPIIPVEEDAKDNDDEREDKDSDDSGTDAPQDDSETDDTKESDVKKPTDREEKKD